MQFFFIGSYIFLFPGLMKKATNNYIYIRVLYDPGIPLDSGCGYELSEKVLAIQRARGWGTT